MIHYMDTYNLWSFVFRCFDIHWVLLGKVMDVMFNWRNWVGKHFFSYLEYGSFVFDEDYLEGR